jgi:hypothetical protein
VGKRLFWLALGAGLAVFVVVKGREYYQKLTPEGVRNTVEETGVRAVNWVKDFVDTVQSAAAEREAELLEALDEGQLRDGHAAL